MMFYDFHFAFGLFMKGFLVGASLCVIPFIFGYISNSVLNLMKGE